MSLTITHRSPLIKHLIIFSVTCVSIFISGYHFGTFDQAIHIPFLYKTVDPSLFPNDPLIDLKKYHYSFFWYFFAPLVKLNILEAGMFVVHACMTYFTFWAFWTLSHTLFGKWHISAINTIIFTAPHISFGGFSLIEFSLLNRTFALPFLVYAINAYLTGRRTLAFALIGLIYNIHAPSATFVLIMVASAEMWAIKKNGVWSSVQNFALFIMCALPVLIWKFSNSSAQLTADWYWFRILKESTLNNVFSFFSRDAHIMLATLSGVSLYLLIAALRKTIPHAHHIKTIALFMFASIGTLIVGYLTSTFYPSVLIIQLQIIRIGVFALLFTYMMTGAHLYNLASTGRISRRELVVLLTLITLSPTPLIIVTLLAFQKLIRIKALRYMLYSLCGALLLVGVMQLKNAHVWNPSIHIFAQKDAWYDVQEWAKKNTKKDTIFITPPHLWWFNEPSWRVHSQRTSVATLDEVLEAAFVPEYARDWAVRFDDVVPHARQQFNGNFFHTDSITREYFYRQSREHFQKTAQKYGASYLVVEKPHSYGFAEIYENEKFAIYDLDTSN